MPRFRRRLAGHEELLQRVAEPLAIGAAHLAGHLIEQVGQGCPETAPARPRAPRARQGSRARGADRPTAHPGSGRPRHSRGRRTPSSRHEDEGGLSVASNNLCPYCGDQRSSGRVDVAVPGPKRVVQAARGRRTALGPAPSRAASRPWRREAKERANGVPREAAQGFRPVRLVPEAPFAVDVLEDPHVGVVGLTPDRAGSRREAPGPRCRGGGRFETRGLGNVSANARSPTAGEPKT